MQITGLISSRNLTAGQCHIEMIMIESNIMRLMVPKFQEIHQLHGMLINKITAMVFQLLVVLDSNQHYIPLVCLDVWVWDKERQGLAQLLLH